MSVRVLILAEEDDRLLEDFVIERRKKKRGIQWDSRRLADELRATIDLVYEVRRERKSDNR